MDSVTQLNCDVVVVGGGPAGIAAAITAAEDGKRVVLLDDNPRAGGQIWRGGPAASRLSAAESWFERLKRSSVQTIFGARVFHAGDGIVEAESDRSLLRIHFAKLILATGARELFLPFPGWTLPNRRRRGRIAGSGEIRFAGGRKTGCACRNGPTVAGCRGVPEQAWR